MRRLIMLLLTVLLLLVPVMSKAGVCEYWGCKGKVVTLYTNLNGEIYVGMDGNEKLASCTPVSGVYFTLGTGTNRKEVYASLLSAYITGTEIGVRTADGSSNCSIIYVSFGP